MAGLLGMLEKGGASKGAPAPAAKSPDLKTSIAESMIEAFNSGDAAGVASAFERMYDACASGGHGGGELA